MALDSGENERGPGGDDLETEYENNQKIDRGGGVAVAPV